MVAGGQGAPVVSIYHKAFGRNTRLAATGRDSQHRRRRHRHLDKNDVWVAFDTGSCTRALAGTSGAAAKSGTPDPAIIGSFRNHAFFAQPPPKSLDRFAGLNLSAMTVGDYGDAHGAACSPTGWSGEAIEAQAFAYLAVRTLQGAPIACAGTTGVARPMPGGVVAQPQACLRPARGRPRRRCCRGHLGAVCRGTG
jgi:anhydro-N-acetylmuramic acid kinase